MEMSDFPIEVQKRFSERARKIISNASLYQLVEDLAKTVDKHGEMLTEIYNVVVKGKRTDDSC